MSDFSKVAPGKDHAGAIVCVLLILAISSVVFSAVWSQIPTTGARFEIGQPVQHRLLGELVVVGHSYWNGWRYECRDCTGKTQRYLEAELKGGKEDE